jgi:hypothetical protein
MRSMKRMAIATAAFAVVAGGTAAGLALTGGTAHAGEITSCSGTGAPVSCTVTDVDVEAPTSIVLVANSSPTGLKVEIKWSTVCDLNGNNVSSSGDNTSTTDYWDTIDLKVTDPDDCDVTATATLTGTTATNPPSLTLDVDAAQPTATSSPTPSSSSSATSVPPAVTVHLSRGFAGKCVDDAGNSSSERAKVEIWTCSSIDEAQNWSYSGAELHHGNLCINAKGNGKSGSKLILWECTGSANEIWIHRSNGELVEKANGYKLCVDDPAYSTKNGTQLIVYTCHNTLNQHWALP